MLVHDGKRYDSKAIVGAAHGHLPGRQPLTASEFSGGEATVGRLLRKLGFTLQVGDDLTPDRLLLILARLQVYRRNGSRPSTSRSPSCGLSPAPAAASPASSPGPRRNARSRRLLDNYGRDWEGDRVFYPVAALHNAGLWELDADPEQVPSAHGSSVPQRWFEDRQPNGGLTQPIYDLLRESPATRRRQ